MAASPPYKIYRDGEYIGCCKYSEDAAAMVSVSGGVVKWQHRQILWLEGQEEFEAGESYDECAHVIRSRMNGILSNTNQ